MQTRDVETYFAGRASHPGQKYQKCVVAPSFAHFYLHTPAKVQRTVTMLRQTCGVCVHSALHACGRSIRPAACVSCQGIALRTWKPGWRAGSSWCGPRCVEIWLLRGESPTTFRSAPNPATYSPDHGEGSQPLTEPLRAAARARAAPERRQTPRTRIRARVHAGTPVERGSGEDARTDWACVGAVVLTGGGT